jgi:hypothetical protein
MSTGGTDTATERAGAATSEGQGASLEQLRLLWKHRWIILAGVAVALCLDALWVLRQPKIYAASATVQFDPNPPRPLGRQVDDIDTPGAGSYWNLREYYETQYRVPAAAAWPRGSCAASGSSTTRTSSTCAPSSARASAR